MPGFEEVRLGQLLAAEPLAGVRQQEPHGTATMPYVTATRISGGPAFIDSEPEDRTQAVPPGRTTWPGDILLASRGVERRETVPGAIVRLSQPLAYSESLVRIRIDPNRADPDYVRLFLTSKAGAARLAAVASGTTISYLRPGAVEGIKLSLPALEVQRAVAAEITAMEGRLAELQATVGTFGSLVDWTIEGIITGALTLRDIDPNAQG
jgi:hypothetical protein